MYPLNGSYVPVKWVVLHDFGWQLPMVDVMWFVGTTPTTITCKMG